MIPTSISWAIFWIALGLAVVLTYHDIRKQYSVLVNNIPVLDTEAISKEIEKIVKDTKPQEGSLDTVTDQDKLLIAQMAHRMIRSHGHADLVGLLADRASGVPLNKLMTKDCHECKTPTPRNKQSKD